MNLLTLEGIHHKFDYPLFSDVNLELNQKESIAITGVSGSGKSTLLHIASTFLKPHSGKVKILGLDVYEDSSSMLKIRRNDIAIIFQSHYLFNALNAKENLELSSIISKKKIDKRLLESLKIDDLINRNISELSGGQKQRFSIARALIKKPKIIFADEPTGNLDHKTASSVMNYLFEYIEDNNAVLFLVTHDEKIATKCKYNLNF
ncbi:MAG: ABC transporter ATP-binding protein [uncultured Campylobacterales bacterium]|uniref:ABC transporter ATP-binding protein n=1 Tax=uncultured Campylobacterales bacterium TaxID=352960 RepID=A0A6S6TFE5_9BACT|nr:MAG: ABC transporter ATP-binding protein [uncultured Campylobacterales bacterium]